MGPLATNKKVFAGVAVAILVLAVQVEHRIHSPRVVVTAEPVTKGSIVQRILATGTLQAVTTVQVGTQVSGTIAALEADFNSVVKKGQPLAKLDPALFVAQVQQAEAAVGQAEAQVKQAEAGVQNGRVVLADARQKQSRLSALAQRQINSPADVDAANIALGTAKSELQAAEHALKAAQAVVGQARASLRQAQVNLEHCTITSPIDGIVVQRSVDRGQTVAANVLAPTLFVIAADLTHVQVQVDVDESDIAGIAPGQPAIFEVEAYPGQVFRGTVASVRLQPVTTQTSAATAGPAATSTTAAPSTTPSALTTSASSAGSPTATATSGQSNSSTTGAPSTLSTTSASSAGSPTTTTTSAQPAATPGSTGAASAAIVNYATLISVMNPDEKLRPGMTATVSLGGTRRDNVIRIPNNALSFRPPSDVAQALGQSLDRPRSSAVESTDDRRLRQVWTYDGRRFTPAVVRTGLTDGQWTEMISGSPQAGEMLVTSAVVSR